MLIHSAFGNKNDYKTKNQELKRKALSIDFFTSFCHDRPPIN